MTAPAPERRLAVDRWLLWLLLALPLAWQSWRYAAELIYYGEYVHWTGVQSARLLLVSLAVTPLLKLFPRIRAIRWLMRRRRDIGLAVFAYAIAHTLAYLVRKGEWTLIWEEGIAIDLLTGWVALVIFIPLALTSNNAALRSLGRVWKRLHRLVYAAAILTYLHWILTAFDPTVGLVHGGIAILLLVYRLRPSGRLDD